MQKNILVAIFAILTVAILAIFVLMLDVGGNVPFIATKKSPDTTLYAKKKKVNTFKKFDKNYYFPVDILYVKIDLDKKSKSIKRDTKVKNGIAKNVELKKAFQLVVDKSDRYSLFCIKQTLNLFSLPYIIVNEGGKSKIIVDSNDRKSLSEVAKKLQQYEIKSQIKRLNI